MSGQVHRIVVRDGGEVRGILFVCETGVVTLYAGQEGTFGYYWQGRPAFGEKGILAFLADVEGPYVAQKMCMRIADKKQRRTSEHYICEIWQCAKTAIRVYMEGK